MKEYKPMRGIRMNDELYEKLQLIAKNDNRSYNQLAIVILSNYVKYYEMEHGTLKLNQKGN